MATRKKAGNKKIHWETKRFSDGRKWQMEINLWQQTRTKSGYMRLEICDFNGLPRIGKMSGCSMGDGR
jgi:hypothetical protein